MTFLGYGFYQKREEIGFRVPPEKIKKMKERIREITNRNWSISIEERIKKLNRFLTGWIQYYKLSDMKNTLRDIDGWTRTRLRAVRWKEWKKIPTKIKNLTKLGINRGYSYMYANTRKSYWRVANSPILKKTLTNQYWKEQGFKGFLDYYSAVKVYT